MKKVLWLTPGIYPLDGGRQLGSWGYIVELNKICKLKVISRLDESIPMSEVDMRLFGGVDIVFEYPYRKRNCFTKYRNFFSKYESRKMALTPINDSFLQTVLKTAKEFQPDIIVIDHITMYNYYRVLKAKFRQCQFIYNSHNVEYKNIQEEYRKSKYWLEKRKQYEHELLHDSKASLCVSRYDIETFKQEFPDCENMLYAKPLIYFENCRRDFDVSSFNKNLLIVGSMNWYPNVRGIIWFIENVFLELIKKDSEYVLYLVGNKPVAELKQLSEQYKNNIIVTGWVPETDIYFKKCDISIVPIFEGTGAKIKVLESIGKAIPTIASSFAAKDYDITEEMIIADDADAFLEAILSLQNSREKREKLIKAMERYYSSYFEINPDIAQLFM